MDLKLDTISQVLTNHFARTPAMQVEDVYKLLHQAAMGSEHAVENEQAIREMLMAELARMGDGPDDPLLDPLSPDGQILRVHLRPFVRAQQDPEKLLRAFIRTAAEWPGSSEMLKEYGIEAVHLARAGTGPIRPDEIEAFWDQMEKQGFPAVHHSAKYQYLYRPAYRVVARQFMEA